MKDKKIIIGGCILLFILAIVIVIFVANQGKSVHVDIKVPNYYSLANFNYNGDFNEFYQDTYNWYKLIENEAGVHIINTSYISEELLQVWNDNKVYNAIPNNAFWEFTVSPSYLNIVNISVEQQDLDDAARGVRLYLVPDTLQDEEFEAMRSYLEETALYGVDQSIIKTNFVKSREVRVARYSPKGPYFTWPSVKGVPITDDDPVIYVCTAENMKYFESESLIATGVDSYIKFANEGIVEKFTKDESLMKYHLNFKTSSEIYRSAAKSKLVDSGIATAFEP